MIYRQGEMPLSPPVSPGIYDQDCKSEYRYYPTDNSFGNTNTSTSGYADRNVADRIPAGSRDSRALNHPPPAVPAQSSWASGPSYAYESTYTQNSSPDAQRYTSYSQGSTADPYRHQYDGTTSDAAKGQLTPDPSLRGGRQDGNDSGEDIVDDGEEEIDESQLTPAERRALKRKMKRFRLTHSQTRFLLNEFAKQAHPDAAHRERLSREIPGLSPRQVQVWFQNRRAKLKRLTVEDQERMMKSRALPATFDMTQAMHSPFGMPSSSMTMGLPQSTYLPYSSQSTMRPISGAVADYNPYTQQYSATSTTVTPTTSTFPMSVHDYPKSNVSSPSTGATTNYYGITPSRPQDSPMQTSGIAGTGMTLTTDASLPEWQSQTPSSGPLDRSASYSTPSVYGQSRIQDEKPLSYHTSADSSMYSAYQHHPTPAGSIPRSSSDAGDYSQSSSAAPSGGLNVQAQFPRRASDYYSGGAAPSAYSTYATTTPSYTTTTTTSHVPASQANISITWQSSAYPPSYN